MSAIFRRSIPFLSLLLVGAIAHFCYRFWTVADAASRSSIVGAFAGAFFAFLFVVIAAVFSRIYSRRALAHNAVVRLDHYLNEVFGALNDQIHSIKKFQDIAKQQADNSDRILFHFGSFEDLPIDKSILIDLLNLDLINAAYRLMFHLGRVNSSITTLLESYSDFRRSFMNGRIDPETYRRNFIRVSDQLNHVQRFLIEYHDECINVSAMTRMAAKRKPLLTRLAGLISQQHFTVAEKRELPEIKKAILGEISEVEAESMATIDRLTREDNNSEGA